MFEKNGDVPKIIARFGESLTPAMIERYSFMIPFFMMLFLRCRFLKQLKMNNCAIKMKKKIAKRKKVYNLYVNKSN